MSPPAGGGAPLTEADIESHEIARLLAETAASAPWPAGPDAERRVRELVTELGLPKAEGESRQDYANARVGSGRRLLQVRADDEA